MQVPAPVALSVVLTIVQLVLLDTYERAPALEPPVALKVALPPNTNDVDVTFVVSAA